MLMNKKLRIGILFGGRSVEHEISLRSATNVAANMDKEKFEPILIGIDKNGGWYLCERISKDIASGSPISFILDSKGHYFLNSKSGEKLNLDLVFPALHGEDGEDGSVQGMLTMAKIPFAGSGVTGSGNSMDKFISKKLLLEAGVPVGKYVQKYYHEKGAISFDSITEKIGLPFIIKPSCSGSSVGVNKVNDESNFKEALDNTFKYDNSILFEEFIEGRELECAIIGNEKPIASNPGEVVISGDYEFYTYTAKYMDEAAAKIIVPADVPSDIAQKVKKLSIQAYHALNCEDFARVDLFLKENGEVLVNEINTIPGFTDVSMFPVLWQEEGISYKNLITKLIDFSLEKFKQKNRLETNFDS